MTLPPWPEMGSNPPASFFNIHGFATYLNQNPVLKGEIIDYFIPYQITSTLSSLGFDASKVPLAPDVTTLSHNQLQLYKQQLSLFDKVYTYNSNAYFTSLTTNIPPMYYTFKTYQELTQYKSATALVNKLYPFEILTQLYTFPFPVYM
jgi:hypothetical protein